MEFVSRLSLLVSFNSPVPFVRRKTKRTKSGRNGALRPAHARKISGGGAKSLFNCFEQLQFALLHFIRQWRVIERGRKLLSLRDRPFQESNEFLPAFGVLGMLVNEHPARAGNRISLVAGRIDHRET